MEYNSKDTTSTILGKEYYNGRVDILTAPSSDILFKMREQTNRINAPSDYSSEALKGEFECNNLAKVFFSKENIQKLQEQLKSGVYKKSKNTIVIPNQSIDNMKIIMRRTYYQYAQDTVSDKSVRNEVKRLNDLILQSIIPSVYNAAIAYQKYQRDVSQLPMPMQRPRQVDRDFKHLEINNFVSFDV